jgi:hypothetical protein
MAITNNVSIITDGLVMCFDAANSRSYTSGNTWTDLTNNSTADVTPITFAGSGGTSHFSFSGSDSIRAQVTGVSALQYGTGPRTVMAWVYPTSTSGWKQIFGWGSGDNTASGLAIDTSGKWATFSHNSAVYSSNASAVANTWSHVVVTHSSSGHEIYINGVLDKSGANTINVTQSAAYIGASFNNNEWWQGRIAQVLFYNKKLTAAEIKQNYNATKSRYGK